jgi:hypothetical protein
MASPYFDIMPPKHFVNSLPHKLWYMARTLGNYDALRKESYKIAKKAGILGGVCVFHPFRWKSKRKSWVFSPHFHIVGFGWLEGKEVYKESGWITKNLGTRTTYDDLYDTLSYELSHCGISQQVVNQSRARGIVSSITWFGSLSYNKLKVPDSDKKKCPHCGAYLSSIRWWGVGVHPCKDLDEGGYLLDPGGWDYDDSYGFGDVYV